MTEENANLPAPLPPGSPQNDAAPLGTALQTQESPPDEAPPAATTAPAPRSPGMIMLALFAALLAIASALYFSRGRPPAPEGAAARDDAAPVTIELPVSAPPAAAGAHDAPSPANPSPTSTSPAKIFNDAGSFKESLERGGPARAATEGAISELPPAPHSAPDGASANDALRDAAKAASRRVPPADDPQADEAPVDEAMAQEPEASLSTAATREIAQLRNEARQALAFAALAAKARAGEPFAKEVSAYLSIERGAPLSATIAAHAPAGIATPATLSARFPAFRNKALAAGRRAEAKGPAARLRASLASLVNLRPAEPSAGSTTAAILSRAEGALAAGDLASALDVLPALNPDAAAALAPWTQDAAARLALEQALTGRELALYAALDGGQPGQ